MDNNKDKEKDVINLSSKGEILKADHQLLQYKKHSFFEQPSFTFFVMGIACVIDASVFYNLFSLISFDAPILILIQISAMLLGFDICPVYVAVELKKRRLGLKCEKFPIILGFTVMLIVFAINLALRLLTIKLIYPESAVLFAASEKPSTDPAAIALTIFSIFVPLITSGACFLVSYINANPLEQQKKEEEAMLYDLNDRVRRLEANISEYENYPAELLYENDLKQFDEMKNKVRILLISYCQYVRQRLQEELRDPAAISALSDENSFSVLKKFDNELNLFNTKMNNKNSYINTKDYLED